MGEVVAMLAGSSSIIGHNWPIYLNFHGGRGFSPFLGQLLVLFPWGTLIVLAGLGLGNLFHSPAIPLVVVILLPIFTTWLNGPSIVLWCSILMVLITLIKRVEANQRPLPTNQTERRKVILRRILLDRDIQDHRAWIRKKPQD